MKQIKTEDLKGGEILGKPIITSEFSVLLPEETVLRKEYIDKIKELGISVVYIKESNNLPVEEIVFLRNEVEEVFKNKVKNILERHTYYNNTELSQLSDTAEEIITSILEEDEVIDKIYDIKDRSADIYEHSINLCSLATLTALKLKMSREVVHDIGVGCLLHDLGLRYLTINYENQDIESLSKVEINEYKKHPVYGYSAVREEGWLSNLAKNMILYHHERLDGSGYPLRAKEIPFDVAIITVCDVFDEMICGIGCPRVKVYEAVEYLKIYSGVKFYPKIVDAFLEFTAVYPVGSRVLLSDGSMGQVKKQNSDFSDRPVILLTHDTKGKLLPRGKEIDLTKQNNIFIEKELV